MERYACRECGHHPARGSERCECECHSVAALLVEGGIREMRNYHGVTSSPEQIQRFGAALRQQLEAKTSLQRLTTTKRRSA